MSRSVIVTGGNRGIGLAIANAFAANGDKVSITSRKDGPVDGLADGIAVVRCDVTVQQDIDNAFAAIEAAQGPVEVLIANAGMTQDGLMVRMNEDAWSSVIDTNLGGAFRCAKRAASSMMKQRKGRIIFMSSVVALMGSAGQVNYAAAKAGLIGMTRSMARELGSRNICVNVIAPGPIATDMLEALTESQREQMIAHVPLGRVGTTHDVASAALFLASEGASYISGAVLPVDGGMGMGH